MKRSLMGNTLDGYFRFRTAELWSSL